MPNSPKPISPTLVIGLGTAGLKILELFQQFVFEEYGRYDLPIFSFLSFETWQNIPKHRSIDLNPIVIRDMNQIKFRMKERPNDPAVKAMDAWLPSDLRMDEAFVAGARGLRPGGRLILWHNWNEVYNKILEAWQGILNVDNKKRAETMLRELYLRRGMKVTHEDVLISPHPVVYVVGTFCGGSCSGMFIDMGFLVKSICGGSPATGIFTLISTDDAKQRENKIPTLNCYGALRELDFYYQDVPEGAWSYVLGDGDLRVEAGKNSFPYDPLFLISRKSESGIILKEDSLNQMIAMKIFLDIIGGVRAFEDSVRTDLQPKIHIHVRNTQGFSKSFYSFGLSAVRYPKYKISGEVACRFAKQLIGAWIGTDKEDPIPAREAAEKDWLELWPKCDQALKTPANEDLFIKISETVKRIAREKGITANLAANIRSEMENPALFETELRQVDDRVITLTKELNRLLQERFESRFNSAAFNLNQLRIYLNELKEFASKESAAWENAERTDFSTRTLDPAITIYKQVNKDFFVSAASLFGLTGLKKKALLECRQRYLQLLIKLWHSILQSRINSHKKHILREWAAKVDQMETGLDLMSNTINKTRDKINELSDEFSKVSNSEITELVYAHGSFEDDVNQCKASLQKKDENAGLSSLRYMLNQENGFGLGQRTPWAFFNRDKQAVADDLVDYYQKIALDHLISFNVLEKGKGVPTHRLPSLAHNAKPFICLNERYEGYYGQRSGDFVFASDPDNEVQVPVIKKIALDAGLSPDTIPRTNCYDFALEQMLFFYREKRAFAINEIDSFDPSKRKSESSREELGDGHFFFTHKGGESFFNAARFMDMEEVYAYMTVSKELFPDDVFRLVNERDYIFFIQRGYETRSIRVNKPDTWKEIYEMDGGKKQLEDRVMQALRKMGKEEYANRIRHWQEQIDLELLSLGNANTERHRELTTTRNRINLFNNQVVVPLFGSME